MGLEHGSAYNDALEFISSGKICADHGSRGEICADHGSRGETCADHGSRVLGALSLARA